MYTPIARNGSLPSAKARKNGWFFVCQRSRIARTSSTTLGAVELTGVVMGSSSSRPGRLPSKVLFGEEDRADAGKRQGVVEVGEASGGSGRADRRRPSSTATVE